MKARAKLWAGFPSVQSKSRCCFVFVPARDLRSGCARCNVFLQKPRVATTGSASTKLMLKSSTLHAFYISVDCKNQLSYGSVLCVGVIGTFIDIHIHIPMYHISVSNQLVMHWVFAHVLLLLSPTRLQLFSGMNVRAEAGQPPPPPSAHQPPVLGTWASGQSDTSALLSSYTSKEVPWWAPTVGLIGESCPP